MHWLLRWLINLGLLAALCLFVTGVFAPLLELEKFWVFKNQFSLYSGLQDLWQQGEHFLFVFLFMFSILTPLVKIFGLTLVVNSSVGYQQRHKLFLQILAIWGKWSMLDVFVVALLFVAVKLGALANITVHYGLYLFAGSVILVHILSFYLYLDSRAGSK